MYSMLTILRNLGLAILAVFAPIQTVIITTGCLIFADLVIGVTAARKRGEAISSAGFRRTVTKLFVYEAVIMLAYLTETYLTGNIIPVSKIASAYIGLTELTSIIESLNEINGGNVLSSLISKLGSQNDNIK